MDIYISKTGFSKRQVMLFEYQLQYGFGQKE